MTGCAHCGAQEEHRDTDAWLPEPVSILGQSSLVSSWDKFGEWLFPPRVHPHVDISAATLLAGVF